MTLEKKDKIQLGITGVLILLLIVLMASNFSGRKKKASLKKKRASVVQPIAPAPAAAGIPLERLQQEAADLKLERDPFTRQPGGTSAGRGPALKGIAWDPQEPTAIISGRIVRIGDEVEGHRVADIQKDKVILNDGTQDIELKLEGE